MNNYIKINNIYLFYFFSLLIIPLGFLIRLLYSRTISVEEFGILYSIISFLNFLFLFTNLGLSGSLRHFIPKFLIKKNYQKVTNLFYYALIIQFLLTLIVSTIIYLSSNFLALNYFHNNSIIIFIKIFLIYFIFLNLFTTLSDVFIAYRLNIYYQTITFLQLFITLLFSSFFYLYEINTVAIYYALSWGIGTFIAFLIYILIIFKKFPYLFNIPRFDKELFLTFLSYSKYMFISTLGIKILSQIDIFVITYFLSLIHVAYYSNAFALINILISFFVSVSILFTPIFTELKEKKDFKRINNILKILYEFIIFLIFPIILIYFLFSEELIKLIFGIGYVNSTKILMVFSLFAIFKILYHYNILFINGLGIMKETSKWIILILIFNLIFDIFLINFFGILGVSFVTICSWIILTILTFKIISKDTNFQLNYLKLFKIILLSGIFLLLVIFFKKYIFILKSIIPNILVNHILIVILAYIIYLILGYYLKIFRLKELYIFIPSENLKKKIQFYHDKYFSFLK